MNNLKAGRELDALIAYKVMGFDIDAAAVGDAREYCWDHNTIGECFRIPYYSTEIASAWQVFCKLGPAWQICQTDPGGWEEEFRWWCFLPNEYGEGSATMAPTAPLAICLAALKAMEER